MANQFARRKSGGHFVTMSAGNYGKSFAFASKFYGCKGKVVMPETAPVSRSILIQVSRHQLLLITSPSDNRVFNLFQGFGVEVERVPTSHLLDVVNRCVEKENMTFLHSYDDLDLIAGHARCKAYEAFHCLIVPN